MRLSSRWRTSCNNPDPDNDLDHDCDMDVVDIMLVAVHWKEKCE